MMTAITTHDGQTFDAYCAKPNTPNGAAVIVIQEIFGVNAEVRKKCDLWAENGYLALAPDLFWRQERGIDITPRTQADWDKAMGLLRGFDVDAGVADLKSTLATARALGARAVGTVGYCLGGRMAYLMATRSDADANVGYYGVTIENYLDESTNIKAPLMLHIAEEDSYVSKEAQEHIKSVLGKNTYTAIYSYAGANHAFSRLGGDHYDETAATLANGRTADFFAKHLIEKVKNVA
jgi:carboxymethylenebutenolidase